MAYPYYSPPPPPSPSPPPPTAPSSPLLPLSPYKPSSPPSYTPSTAPQPPKPTPGGLAPAPSPPKPPLPTHSPGPAPSPKPFPYPPPLTPLPSTPFQGYGPPPLYGVAPPPPSSSNVVVPPPSGGSSNHTTIIAVCVSLGGALFLAFLLAGLVCLAKRKKKPIYVPETAACVEEHEVIQEMITTGPCGEETVTVSIDEDAQIHEIAVGATAAMAGGPSCEPGQSVGGPSPTHGQGHPHQY